MSVITKSEYYNKISPASKYRDLLDKACEFRAIETGETDIATRIKEADCVINNAEKILTRFKKLPLVGNGQEFYQPFVAIIVCGIYMYYLYLNYDLPIISLVAPREYAGRFGKACGIGDAELERIFEVASAAAGVDGPEYLKARPDTPNEIFCLAKFIHDNKEALV